jgi:hypothetical protein
VSVFHAQDSLDAVSKEPAGGLGQLQHHGVKPQLIEVLLSMRRYQTRLEEYGSRELCPDERLKMAMDQNRIQYQLISFPTGEFKTAVGRLGELLRLCALLYGISVTFPIPQNRNLRRVLVWSIRDLLGPSECNWLALSYPGFLMWSLVLAGTSAFDLPGRSFFVDRITRLCVLNGWSEWSDVEPFLSDFLWLNSACNQAGMHLWVEVGRCLDVS